MRLVGGAAAPRPPGRIAAAGVLGALACAVVAAASSGLLSRLRAEVPTFSTGAVLGYVVAVLLAVMLLGAVGIAYVTWVERARGRREPEPAIPEEERPRQSADWSAWLMPLFLVAVIALGIALGWLFGRPGSETPPSRGGLPSITHTRPPSIPASAPSDSLPVAWLVFAALSGVGSAAAAVLLVRDLRRRRRAPGTAAGEELVVAVDESIDDLEREPDPRLAVIRAYGRMERTLALRGAGRRPPETPLEYLPRALGAVRLSRGSISRLTSLFQRAKYSPHAVDASMRREAIEALDDLRAELTDPGAAR